MGTVNEAEFPDWATSGEGVAAFALLLKRHVEEQVTAITAGLPEHRSDSNFMQLAQGYTRFVETEFTPLLRDIGSTVWTGPGSSLPDRLRRAAATHNQYVERFRRFGVEPILPDSAAPPGSDSWGWKPWAFGGLAIAGVFAIGYLLVSASKAKTAFGVKGMPEVQSFAGAKHSLRSGSAGRRTHARRTLRGYNLEVEPQHR